MRRETCSSPTAVPTGWWSTSRTAQAATPTAWSTTPACPLRRGWRSTRSGDVFIADTGNNRVVVDKPNGSGGYTQSVVDNTGLSSPRGWRSTRPGTCSSPMPATTGWWSPSPTAQAATRQSVVDDTGLSFPTGVAVDASGDVFIADTGNNRVLKETPLGAGGYSQSVVGFTGLNLSQVAWRSTRGGRVHRRHRQRPGGGGSARLAAVPRPLSGAACLPGGGRGPGR